MVKVCIISAAVLLLSGCTTVNCRQAVEGAPVLEVWHSSGGFAPIMSSIRVYGNRHLIYEPPRGRVRCLTLRSEEYEAINELVDDDHFLVVVAEADAAATHYGELEEIFLKTPDFSASIPLEVAPAELRGLLRVVASILQRHAGRSAPWSEI